MITLVSDACSRCWRTLGTGFSFAVFGLGALVIGLLFLLLVPLPISQRHKQVWIRTTISKACQLYINMMRVMGLLTYHLDVGKQKGGGQLIIANHPTLLDAIFLLAAYRNVCCIAKGALWDSPFTSFTMRLAGYIPNHSETLVECAIEKLAAGENLLIFPEGTRSQGDRLLDFKRGAANVAIQANCIIVPVIIECVPKTLQKGEKWYQIPDAIPHFSLMEKPAFTIADIIDTDRPRTVQYRHLTRYFRQYFLSRLS